MGAPAPPIKDQQFEISIGAVDRPPGAFMPPKSRSDAPISPRRPYFHFPFGESRRLRLSKRIFPGAPTAAPSVPFNTLRRRQVLASSLAAFAWIDASLLSTASVKNPDAAVRQPTHAPALRACGALPTRGHGSGCRSHRAAVLPRSDRA